jgi:large subunit ribosomal protein L21
MAKAAKTAPKYAIFESGGKQHRVAPGEVIALEKVDAEPGASVTFDKVLLIATDAGTQVGTPHLDGAAVSATVVEQFRDRKILIFKKKRRKNFRKTQGHRQNLTRVRIESISA